MSNWGPFDGGSNFGPMNSGSNMGPFNGAQNMGPFANSNNMDNDSDWGFHYNNKNTLLAAGLWGLNVESKISIIAELSGKLSHSR
jgi:hypothetical protein